MRGSLLFPLFASSLAFGTRPLPRSSVSLAMSSSPPVDAPYGAWTSPVTSSAITAGSVSLGPLLLSPSLAGPSLLWLEGRPLEGGRNVLCRRDPAAAGAGSRGAVDVTPEGSNVRTRVHEYGGGAVCLGPDGTVFYSEFRDQRLMRLEDGTATALTPDGGRWRFADGECERSGERIVAVREDHADPAPARVVNEVAAVRTDGSGGMEVLATGRDFYAHPRLSPDGSRVAYVTWNHPSMPWDATELRLAPARPEDAAAAATDAHELVAGEDGDTSILQPTWDPHTGRLYYLSDASGFYNIYRAGTKDPILPMDKDFGGAAPGWRLGQQAFGFLPDGRLWATYGRDGGTVLLTADASGDGPAADVVERSRANGDGLPAQFSGIVADGTTLYMLGGGPAAPGGVFSWSLADPAAPAAELARSSTLELPADVISVPEVISFPTTLGDAFGYYYPPVNGAHVCTTEAAPPLLVKAHGGPTACTSTSFNPGVQFWTSRGFAVLDVDYGGSTGYGRDYRRRLRGAWGVVDVDDVCAGAKYLAAKGLADPERTCIDGGSAGGYTTLGALAFRDVFRAGCSLYGVGDLAALAGDTHKFESRYLDGLVGPYPQEEQLYKERSPIESVDTLSCPILLLQGDEDKIVPPNQAEKMHAALMKKGIPSCLKIYEGEQHGFRKAENIEDALDSELAFYGKVFGIDVPGALELHIENL